MFETYKINIKPLDLKILKALACSDDELHEGEALHPGHGAKLRAARLACACFWRAERTSDSYCGELKA